MRSTSALLGPVQDIIKDKHLLVVPSGPLTSLPFSVLVTEPPKTAMPAKFADYRQAAWLGARQPISVLPSVASLAALRRHAKGSAASDPFLGFGDPVLAGQPGCAQIVVPDKCPDEEARVACSHERRGAQRKRPADHCQLLPCGPGRRGRGAQALSAARHRSRAQMRGAQSRRAAECGRARQGHDRGRGQDGGPEPLSGPAFRHPWPAGRRDGAAGQGPRRARAGPVPARSADGGGRRPIDRLGGGGL